MTVADIDAFVDFLIMENCDGCSECEPRLPQEWANNICVEEGRAKWLLEKKQEFLAKEKMNHTEGGK